MAKAPITKKSAAGPSRPAPAQPAKPAAAAAPPPKPAATLPPPPPVPAVFIPPDAASMLLEDAGSGMEGMTAADYAIPRMSILQALSPQVQPQDPKYIEGAKPGMILDNVGEACYDGTEGILAVLVSFRRAHLEWYPRDSRAGKGFVADHGADESVLRGTTRDDKGRNMTPRGTEIVPTLEYFALIVDEETGQTSQALISMSKTQVQKAKRLNTQIGATIITVNGRSIIAPMFYHAYRFTTVPESNDKGHWMGWRIERAAETLSLTNGQQIYLAARAFKKNVAEGKVKVSAPNADNEHSAEANNAAQSAGDDAPM